MKIPNIVELSSDCNTNSFHGRRLLKISHECQRLLSSCTTMPYKARIIRKRQSINHGKSSVSRLNMLIHSDVSFQTHRNLDGLLLKKSSTAACFKDFLANGCVDQSF